MCKHGCGETNGSRNESFGRQAGKSILTPGSEEERVVIAFIFNGGERDNLDKVICFKFHIQERLRFHSLKGNKDTYSEEELSSPPPPTKDQPTLTATKTQFQSLVEPRKADSQVYLMD